MRRRVRRLTGAAAMLLTGLACGGDERSERTVASSSIGPALENWLTCIECDAGQLDSVLALVARDARALDSLNAILLAGTGVSAAVDSQLRTAYAELSAEPAEGAFSESLPSEQEYVEHFRENFVRLRMLRAAIAVARSGSPVAARVLDSAAAGLVRHGGDTIPVAVRRRLGQVRERLRVQ